MSTWQSPHHRPLPAVGGRTLIMGILNVTPDSFSDGGRLGDIQAVVDRAGEMIAAGADVLDVGGESTRPGAIAVSVEEECARVLPAIDALRASFPAIPISIDTYKSVVADRAIQSGADIINDIWGLMHELDPAAREQWRQVAKTPHSAVAAMKATQPVTAMARVAKERNVPVIVMHNRPDRNYGNFWDDVLLDLRASLAVAKAAGIEDHQLWTDPGFGFAKNVSQNLEVLRQLDRIVGLGYPVLVGTSRKSTLGAVTGSSMDARIEAGAATVVWAIQQGCQMVRVHDVAEMARYARMADAIKAGLGFASDHG